MCCVASVCAVAGGDIVFGLTLSLSLMARRVKRNADFDTTRHVPFKCVDVVLLGEID